MFVNFSCCWAKEAIISAGKTSLFWENKETQQASKQCNTAALKRRFHMRCAVLRVALMRGERQQQKPAISW